MSERKKANAKKAPVVWQHEEKETEDRSLSILGKIIVLLICIAILVVAFFMGKLLLATGPKAEKKIAEAVIPVVEVKEVSFQTVTQKIEAEGETRAKRESHLMAEVAGKVVSVSDRFEVGEIFESGEVLLRLENADYQAVLAQARSTLEDARLTLSLEEARAKQAKREWAKMGKGGEPNDLVLRKPQLASAQARITAAAAAVQKSERDLDRATIRAPYRCQIREKGIQIGSVAMPGSSLALIMSAESVEVALPIQNDDLAWLQKKGDQFVGKVTARAEWEGREQSWSGKILRSEGLVDRATRNLRIVVSFEEDLPPVGLFVNAEIEGRDMEKVFNLPASVLADDGSVWLLDEENHLRKQKVEIKRTTKGQVYLSEGIEEGDRVCVKLPATPVVGMKVELKGESPEASQDEEKPEAALKK